MINRASEKLLAYWKDTEKPLLIDWLLLGIIVIFLFFTFMYSDIMLITYQSVSFDNCLFTGHLFDFYKDTYNRFFSQTSTMWSVTYDVPFFAFFGLWDIPLWIAQKFYHVNLMTSIPALIWVKSFLIVCYLLTCKVIYLICKLLDFSNNAAKWTVFVFASSATALAPLLLVTQSDILSVLFMLLGIYFLLKDKKIYFIATFAVAICLKLFAFFIFFPLILLKEKRILKVIGMTLGGISLELISKLLFLNAPFYKQSVSPYSSQMFGTLWCNGINANFGIASIFAIALLFICVIAYIQKDISDDLYKRYVIYIPLFTYLAFFSTNLYHPYWLIIISPFIAIAIMQNSKYIKILTFIEMLYSTCSLIFLNLMYFWECNDDTINLMRVLPSIFGYPNQQKRVFRSPIELFTTVHITTHDISLFVGIFFACSIAMILLTYPRKNIDSVVAQQNQLKIDRSVMWLHALIVVPFASIIIVCYYLVR